MTVKRLLKQLKNDRDKALLSAYQNYAAAAVCMCRDKDKWEEYRLLGDRKVDELNRLDITIEEIEKRVS